VLLAAAVPRLPLAQWRRLTAVLLSLACCYLAARLLWLLVPAPNLAAATPVPAISPSAGLAMAPAIDLSALKGLELFGATSAQAPAKTQALPAALAAAEDTRLDLQLQGILGSADHAHDRAIIAHKGSQGLFAPGDALPGGSRVTLERILEGRVILNNAGNYESLWLYESDQTAQPARTGAVSSSSAEPPVRAGAAPQAEPAAAPAPTAPAASAPRSAPASMTGTLADIVRFTAEQKDGRLLGYRIAPGPAAQRFHALGFHDQDLVTAVNGVTMDNPSNALQVYRQLREGASARFDLQRDGASLSLTISLNPGDA
jgi:general secretion pathway protein C